MADPTPRRFLQERIKVTYYNSNDEKITQIIRAKTVKPTHKQDVEKLTASDSTQAYAVAYGEQSHELQLSEVDPDQMYIFEYIYKRQRQSKLKKMPTMTTYYYNNTTGKITQDKHFPEFWVEEISNENHKPYDVKIGVLEATF